MAIKPSVPEVITVNSEELQTQIRDLLPSQNGFGSELQATNVITPIIDLTSTAEGSTLRNDLQTAIAFGSQTEFLANNSTAVVANTVGFFRVFGVASIRGTANTNNLFQMSDGLATKDIWRQFGATGVSVEFDFVVWLRPGDSLSAISSTATGHMAGSVRQIADSTGSFVQPSGFPL